jgi:hypothetical protein
MQVGWYNCEIMGLPDSYTMKPGSIPAYFDAIVNAQPPDRFSNKFLEGLGFKSTNDRLIIGVLKDLGFLDSDAKPTPRYFAYLDRSQSARVLADGIREAFSDLFAIRTTANEFNVEEVRDKLRTLYAGTKSDELIKRISVMFVALCEIADFTAPPTPAPAEPVVAPAEDTRTKAPAEAVLSQKVPIPATEKAIGFRSLQYHINIVLPESRDQAVYDALFKSLRDHLG